MDTVGLTASPGHVTPLIGAPPNLIEIDRWIRHFRLRVGREGRDGPLAGCFFASAVHGSNGGEVPRRLLRGLDHLMQIVVLRWAAQLKCGWNGLNGRSWQSGRVLSSAQSEHNSNIYEP